MLSITNLKGDSEPIADYNNLCIEDEINGSFLLSANILNSDNNTYGFPLINEESIIEYEGHEYRIKGLTSSRTSKNVTATHTFFDLSGVQKHDIYGGTRTTDEIFGWLLDGNGWTYEFVDNIPAAFIPGFGRNSVVALIWEACQEFDCEIEILPGKHLRVHKRIGQDNDFQFRFGHNIKSFKNEVDTTNLRTSIKGYGADNLVVTYVSPNADKFPHAGEAEPVRDERFTIAENLLEKATQALVDTPEASIEISEIDLGESKGLGDSVWLIYEPLDVEFQTRIVARKRYPKQPSKNTVTLGTKKTSFTDLLTEQNIKIDENNKTAQSRIDQTNDRITLEVEEIDGAIATIEISIGQIQSTVSEEVERLDGAIEANMSQITQTASSIRAEVSQEVTRLDGRVSSSNSSITILSDRISSKVEETDYNGQTIMSLIEQTPSYIMLSAKKINFDGAVFGNSTATFKGNISTDSSITVGDNIELGSQSDSGYKSIRFNSVGGIRSEGWNISIFTPNGIYLDATEISLNSGSGKTYVQGDLDVRGTISGTVSYANSAGNASQLGGYSASSFARQYTSPSFNDVSVSSSLSHTGGGSYLYVRPQSGSELRVTRVGSTSFYLPVRANSFPTDSSATRKTKRKRFDENATAIIMDLNPSMYHIKADVDALIFDKPRAGFFSEEVPQLLRDEGGVDTYAILTTAVKMNQEQQVLIEQLEKRIDDLGLIIGEIA